MNFAGAGNMTVQNRTKQKLRTDKQKASVLLTLFLGILNFI